MAMRCDDGYTRCNREFCVYAVACGQAGYDHGFGVYFPAGLSFYVRDQAKVFICSELAAFGCYNRMGGVCRTGIGSARQHPCRLVLDMSGYDGDQHLGLEC